MNRAASLIFIALLLAQPAAIQAADKPNITFFLVDDMGWQETSVPFHTETTALNRRYRAPHRERLVARLCGTIVHGPFSNPEKEAAPTSPQPSALRVPESSLAKALVWQGIAIEEPDLID